MEEKKCLEQTENEVAIVSQEIKDTLEMLSKETQSKETYQQQVSELQTEADQ